MSLLQELKRRNVFRVGIAYALIGWLLMQVTDIFAPALLLPDWFDTAVAFLLIIGFPIALFFAWAFELTPEGVRRETEVDPQRSVSRQTGRRIDRLIIVVLLITVGVLLYRQSAFQPAETPPELQTVVETEEKTDQADAPGTQSIAVLPFVNMSADPDNEYFSDGIAEEILNVLARIPELKVAARTSAFAYKDTDANIAEIARELKVSTVLEGSVRKQGDQVRVTAQLIQANDGFHLWSSTYDRELTNIFAIQDEIAQSIAEALKVTLNIRRDIAGNYTGTTDMAAYDAYLRGMNQWHLRTRESLYNAIDLFEEAIGHDPRFARAHAGLALTFAVIPDYTDFPKPEAQARTRKAAQAALALDPTLVEAATAMINSTSDLNEQIELARRAIGIKTSFATAHQWYGTLLNVAGDMETALAELRKAYELDPRSRAVNNNLAYALFSMGRLEEAEAVERQLLSWAPDYTSAWIMSLFMAVHRNDRPGARKALASLQRLQQREPRSVDVYMGLIFDASRRAEAAAELSQWTEREWTAPGNPSLMRPRHLVYLVALIGETDMARELLASLIRKPHSAAVDFFRSDRMLPEFNCDPGVQALYAESGLPRTTIPYPCEELLP